ncbi:MAG: hybrid sensor histidine kinase/response regulator [Anaerolineae bacterium]
MANTQYDLLSSDEKAVRTPEIDGLHELFIQNVSHELRTPLAIVMGYAELLRDGELGPLEPEQKQAILVIARQAQTLHKIVERVGILLAVEAQMFLRAPVDPAEICESVLSRRKGEALAAQLQIQSEIENNLPTLLGDRFQMEQALDALLENAIKFTPTGGCISVRIYGDDDEVHFAIQDTGIGIPHNKMDRLLSGFYQVDGSTTRAYNGLGLGLTVVRAVTHAHDGKLEIHSEEGEGTTCILQLPLSQRRPDQRGESTVQAKRRILIVDDEEMVCMTLQAGLEKNPNFEVTVATSGEEAWEIFQEGRFDLVITDYRMPGLDGLTFAQRVRQLAPEISIILITAYDSETLRQNAARAAVYQILTKPVKLAEIREVTDRTLKATTDQGGKA